MTKKICHEMNPLLILISQIGDTKNIHNTGDTKHAHG